MSAIIVQTPRLTLRPWRDADVDAFAAMFDDPRVMEFLPAPPDRAGIEAIVGRIRAHFVAHGFGWWAAELRATGEFIGFIGLSRVPFEAHFTPAVEVGWRLAAGKRLLGSGLCDRGRQSGARFRLRPAGPARDRFLHGGGQPAVMARHAAHRHDARPGRRFRPSAPGRRRSTAAACAAPHEPGAVGGDARAALTGPAGAGPRQDRHC